MKKWSKKVKETSWQTVEKQMKEALKQAKKDGKPIIFVGLFDNYGKKKQS